MEAVTPVETGAAALLFLWLSWLADD